MHQPKLSQILTQDNQAKVDLSIVESVTSEQLDSCREILEELKDWFGVEKARNQYIRNMSTQKNILANMGKKIVGFLSYKIDKSQNIAEIDVMGVNPNVQTQGIGRKLVESLENKLSKDNIHFIRV